MIEKLDSTAVIKDSRRVGEKTEGRTRKILGTLNRPWEAKLLGHKAVLTKLYVTNYIPVMPALSKEDLEIERKVLRKQYELITQRI